MKILFLALVFAISTSAEVPAWGQCGGKGYSGPTDCASGYTCNYGNEWYYQCQPSQSTLVTTTKTLASTTKTSSSTTSSSPAIPSGTQFLGRVNPSTGELTWPGTGLRFSYNGVSRIDLTATGSNSGELVIDGTTTVIPSVTGAIALPSGNHNVEFRKRSEANMGSIFVKVSGTPATNRLIEFIGDSITVGYGLDGVNPCTNTAQVENNPKTYAALAAKALGADYNIIAWSGKGVTRNYPGDNGALMPEIWTRYGANDADNTYPFTTQAQVVVINLGTNDFSYVNLRDPPNISEYQNAMQKFVQTIKGKYPKAKVFLMSSPMISDYYPQGDNQHTTQVNVLKSVASSTGSYFVDWPTQGSDVGCDYHPNAATHAAEAPVLSNAIRQVMGW